MLATQTRNESQYSTGARKLYKVFKCDWVITVVYFKWLRQPAPTIHYVL